MRRKPPTWKALDDADNTVASVAKITPVKLNKAQTDALIDQYNEAYQKTKPKMGRPPKVKEAVAEYATKADLALEERFRQESFKAAKEWSSFEAKMLKIDFRELQKNMELRTNLLVCVWLITILMMILFK